MYIANNLGTCPADQENWRPRHFSCRSECGQPGRGGEEEGDCCWRCWKDYFSWLEFLRVRMEQEEQMNVEGDELKETFIERKRKNAAKNTLVRSKRWSKLRRNTRKCE